MTSLTERTRMRLYVRRVMLAVGTYYGLDLKLLTAPARWNERVEARMAVVVKCRGAGIPLELIGRLLRREHSTIANAQVRALGAELEPVLAALPEYAPRAKVTPCNGCGGTGAHRNAGRRDMAVPWNAQCGACHGDGGWGAVPLWLAIRRAQHARVAA